MFDEIEEKPILNEKSITEFGNQVFFIWISNAVERHCVVWTWPSTSTSTYVSVCLLYYEWKNFEVDFGLSISNKAFYHTPTDNRRQECSQKVIVAFSISCVSFYSVLFVFKIWLIEEKNSEKNWNFFSFCGAELILCVFSSDEKFCAPTKYTIVHYWYCWCRWVLISFAQGKCLKKPSTGETSLLCGNTVWCNRCFLHRFFGSFCVWVNCSVHTPQALRVHTVWLCLFY